MNRTSTSIEVSGVKETTQALKVFTPEINKRLRREIRSALNDTKVLAQSKYPSGSWSIGFSNKKPLGFIQATAGRRIDNNWGASDGGVKAAIFEFAGSTQSGRTPQAEGLIRSLNNRYGTTGRFLWASWDQSGKTVLEKIRTSMLEAERDLQATINSAGESY